MSKEQDIEALIAPAIESLGLECLGVVFSPGRGSSLVRIYIDQAERGITLDDCEAVSREVSAVLDVNDPITTRYTLEVSSPGLDRPLFKPAHFARFVGEKAKITVKLPVGGRRRFQGKLLAVEGEKITVEQDAKAVVLEHLNIDSARLLPNFSEALAATEKPGKAKKSGEGKKPGLKSKKKKAN